MAGKDQLGQTLPGLPKQLAQVCATADWWREVLDADGKIIDGCVVGEDAFGHFDLTLASSSSVSISLHSASRFSKHLYYKLNCQEHWPLLWALVTALRTACCFHLSMYSTTQPLLAGIVRAAQQTNFLSNSRCDKYLQKIICHICCTLALWYSRLRKRRVLCVLWIIRQNTTESTKSTIQWKGNVLFTLYSYLCRKYAQSDDKKHI